MPEKVDQRPVRHPLSRPDFGEGDRGRGPVTAFRRCLNRREVLLIVVAAAEDHQLLHPRPPAQTQRVAAEHFAGKADQAEGIAEPSPRAERTRPKKTASPQSSLDRLLRGLDGVIVGTAYGAELTPEVDQQWKDVWEVLQT